MSTIIEGVDFANERPGGRALAGAGKHFVIRYLSPDTKNNPGKRLTPAEVTDYRRAGLAICVVWETTTTRATEGRNAGATDATSASAVARTLGLPVALPIFFAVDEDVSGPAVEQYFRGVAAAIGHGRTGVYAGYQPVAYLMSRGLVPWAWQTYAWSGGKWYPGVQLQQYRNGVRAAGVTLDLCRAVTSNYGQWVAPGAPAGGDEDEMKTPPTVQHGATGQSVKNLQALLGAHGVSVATDGSFGDATTAAVKKFQVNEKIGDDGIAGPATWAHLLDVA